MLDGESTALPGRAVAGDGNCTKIAERVSINNNATAKTFKADAFGGVFAHTTFKAIWNRRYLRKDAVINGYSEDSRDM